MLNELNMLNGKNKWNQERYRMILWQYFEVMREMFSAAARERSILSNWFRQASVSWDENGENEHETFMVLLFVCGLKVKCLCSMWKLESCEKLLLWLFYCAYSVDWCNFTGVVFAITPDSLVKHSHQKFKKFSKSLEVIK